ncbi:MAG: hypothetical protein WC760_06100 [Bacteroidia bacterium]|jgi:hypothetical protein
MASILLGLLVVTLMPFNAFHSHTADLHAEAHLKQDTHHHCELDLAFCDDIHAASCGHTSHLSTPVPTCFTCSFPLIKSFTFGQTSRFAPIELIYYLTFEFSSPISNPVIPALMNKGPPRRIA